MELVIQIAAGIVLAVIILRFWRQALALAVVVLVVTLLAVVWWWLEGTALGAKIVAIWSWLTGTWGVALLWSLFSVLVLLFLAVGIYNRLRNTNAGSGEPFQ